MPSNDLTDSQRQLVVELIETITLKNCKGEFTICFPMEHGWVIYLTTATGRTLSIEGGFDETDLGALNDAGYITLTQKERHRYTATLSAKAYRLSRVFYHLQPVKAGIEETRFYEFKEVTGPNSVRAITSEPDEYAVAFLNREGGQIFWGVRNSDRIVVGVQLDYGQRDEIKRIITDKITAIRPHIVLSGFRIECHQVHGCDQNPIPGLYVVEMAVPKAETADLFFTGGDRAYLKTDSGKKRLTGPEIQAEILRRHREPAVLQREQEQQDLIVQMGSPTNEFAREAVRMLRARGWLQDGTLVGANLHEASLATADLTGANLREADLSGANLQGAILRGADLKNAKLHDANLKGAEGLTDEQLSEVDSLRGAMMISGRCYNGRFNLEQDLLTIHLMKIKGNEAAIADYYGVSLRNYRIGQDWNRFRQSPPIMYGPDLERWSEVSENPDGYTDGPLIAWA